MAGRGVTDAGDEPGVGRGQAGGGAGGVGAAGARGARGRDCAGAPVRDETLKPGVGAGEVAQDEHEEIGLGTVARCLRSDGCAKVDDYNAERGGDCGH